MFTIGIDHCTHNRNKTKFKNPQSKKNIGMVYSAIGLMSGSSLDGLDIAHVIFEESGGGWSYHIAHAACFEYEAQWASQLKNAIHLPAREYQLLHTSYGHYLGRQVNQFIEENQLQYKINIISSHGHTTFHIPKERTTAQLGDGAAIAATTGIATVSDLRAMDIALGGQGAPIVPIGEKLLWPEYDFFLNIGGIANITAHGDSYIAYDICAANRVLNMLAAQAAKEYDEGGALAASGHIDQQLLEQLNDLDYFSTPPPKSLANDFGTDLVYPLVLKYNLPTANALCTYTEHIAMQVQLAIQSNKSNNTATPKKMLVTGGGAFNSFLIERIKSRLKPIGIEVILPDNAVVKYKEAVVMALIGVLRWREEYNVLSSVTGAAKNSIGGALWLG